MDARAPYLSPAEAAKRLGVTVKALRLYERHGLVKPLRTAADWRTYGPEQMARLHQVLALKRMGLSLARIAELLRGPANSLASVLELQERMLAGEADRVSHALALVRAARARLAKGDTFSIDDLTTLTRETTVSVKPSPEEMKNLFEPHVAKHFSRSDIAEAAQQNYDPASTQDAWDKLIAEARDLMARGEHPASPAARDLARGWRAMVEMFTRGNPNVEHRVKAVWNDAMTDPKTSGKLPLNPEIFAYMAKAQAAANAAGE
jgi:DNA-binding transcriptional MerR regulator